MAERGKYEKWLADLEAKRGSKSAKAYEKVKSDYTDRLNAVLEKLTEHQAAMQEHAAGLESRLLELESAQEEVSEALAEAELRFDVGEVSDAEWAALSRKSEKELAKIKQDKEVTTEDLERIREMLSGADATAGDASPGDAEEDGVDADTAPAPEPVPKPSDVDELEFLKSVVGATPSGSSEPPMAAKPAAPEPEEPKAAPPQPPQLPPKPKAESLVTQPKPQDKLVSQEESSAMNVTDSNPIVLKSSGGGGGGVAQTKTLKCPECGAMNYPSEWYCERCGAELTNV
ncbi:MAG: zinc finger protein [Gemmatimonadaceae bacterium]